MPRGRQSPQWQGYPPSAPLPVEDGIATSKQRGPMASSWWSGRFVEVLESYGLGGRMQRGRRYARAGQVLSLQVSPGGISGQVQGSRRRPYKVTITVEEPTDEQWGHVEAAMKAKIGFVARLLGGEVPPDLEDVFEAAGVALFPATWGDLRASCSCPDMETPCKHIAAVLYVFADQLDGDPWLILSLRGRGRDSLIASVSTTGSVLVSTPGDEVAPWWPFAPGPLPALPDVDVITDLESPDQPDAIIEALEPLDVNIGGKSFTALLRPLYQVIVDIDRS
jgi:uncharacterized Zn finger protein